MLLRHVKRQNIIPVYGGHLEKDVVRVLAGYLKLNPIFLDTADIVYTYLNRPIDFFGKEDFWLNNGMLCEGTLLPFCFCWLLVSNSTLVIFKTTLVLCLFVLTRAIRVWGIKKI